SRSAEDVLGDCFCEFIRGGSRAFELHQILRLPHEFTIARAESFGTDGYRSETGLIRAALEREQSIGRTGIRHFVERETDFAARPGPVLNRSSGNSIVLERGGAFSGQLVYVLFVVLDRITGGGPL